MPIKKPLPKVAPKPEMRAAPPAKKAAKRSTAKPATPPPEKSAVVYRNKLEYTENLRELANQRSKELGPPLDPATLPGASQYAPSVAGQAWEIHATYQSPPEKYTWVFFDDGTLNHSGSIGVWRQKGAAIVTEINGRYSQHSGVIEGDTASGNASNVVGLKWTWTASRVIDF